MVFRRPGLAEDPLEKNIHGRGIGLAITKELIDLLAGTISVTSEQGLGTTVTFSLPVGIVTDSKAKQSSEIEVSRLKGLRLLLVDDLMANLNLLSRILSPTGAELWLAQSVADAEEILQCQEIDAVLTDIGMPGGSGVDLLELVRANDLHKPVIAVTGYIPSGEMNFLNEAGFDAIITKPVKREVLLREINKHIKLNRAHLGN